MATTQRTAVNTALGLAMLLHLGVSVAAGGGAQTCAFAISSYNKTTDARVKEIINSAQSASCAGDFKITSAERRALKKIVLPSISKSNAEGVFADWWNQWSALAGSDCRRGYGYVLGDPGAVVEKYLNTYACSIIGPRFNAHLRKK